MIRGRRLRASTSIGISLALTLTLFAGQAVAAPAPLAIGLGETVGFDADTGAEPPTVSPGAEAAFHVWALNDGTSNIPRLFLTALTEGELEAVFVSVDGSPSPGSCSEPAEGAELQCLWEPVPPGTTIQVTAVFTTPTNKVVMPIDWEWSTVGYVVETKGKNKSRGDAFQLMDSVDLNGDLTTFAGRWASAALTNVSTNTNLSNRNPQYTSVFAPAANIGVSVGEEGDAVCVTAGVTCFGQFSVLYVDGGEEYPNGIKVEIAYKGNHPNANFVHFFDEGVLVGGLPYELIDEDDVCSDDTPSATELPCKIVTTSQGNTFATLFLTQNGKTGGY